MDPSLSLGPRRTKKGGSVASSPFAKLGYELVADSAGRASNREDVRALSLRRGVGHVNHVEFDYARLVIAETAHASHLPRDGIGDHFKAVQDRRNASVWKIAKSAKRVAACHT